AALQPRAESTRAVDAARAITFTLPLVIGKQLAQRVVAARVQRSKHRGPPARAVPGRNSGYAAIRSDDVGADAALEDGAPRPARAVRSACGALPIRSRPRFAASAVSSASVRHRLAEYAAQSTPDC